MTRYVLSMASCLILPRAAQAHADMASESGVLAYVMATGIAAVLVAALVFSVRPRG